MKVVENFAHERPKNPVVCEKLDHLEAQKKIFKILFIFIYNCVAIYLYGHANNNENKIGRSERDEEQVGDALEFFEFENRENDEQIAKEAEKERERVDGHGRKELDEPLEIVVVLVEVVFGRVEYGRLMMMMIGRVLFGGRCVQQHRACCCIDHRVTRRCQ